MIYPQDLVTALAAYPDARANLEDFGASTQRITLEWIKRAKKPETRAEPIATTVRMAQAGRKPGS
ncbi:MAG: YdeI/OmpD-associated family protein [Henriciella sp.]|uniref:YdeI/OmpD-associated family protein n=1 Tax=Henriciella sp. TaxID=1968823 RepID=UPI003C70A72B